MGRAPRPFTITLTPQEASECWSRPARVAISKLHEAIRSQLAKGDFTIELTDANLGKLIRYMTQYGSGGFQGRLQRAFRRPLMDLLAGREV